jgi:hypothetical protein
LIGHVASSGDSTAGKSIGVSFAALDDHSGIVALKRSQFRLSLVEAYEIKQVVCDHGEGQPFRVSLQFEFVAYSLI